VITFTGEVEQFYLVPGKGEQTLAEHIPLVRRTEGRARSVASAVPGGLQIYAKFAGKENLDGG
jgi:hypothetical protein